MGEEQWFQVSNRSNQVAVLKAANEYTAKFGLVLSDEETSLLLNERRDVLKKEQRVEFGEGILPKLIFAFCDSPYIHQDNYVETLGRLQEIFYFYKNESLDEYTDDELVDAMKELFDGPCQGSLDYLEDTGLQRLAKRARYGLCMDEEEDEEEEDEF
jgi:hypothetical protein